MRYIFTVILILVVCFYSSLSFGGEFVVGKVVECSPGRELIQLRDTIYRVDENVFRDDGVNAIVDDLRINIKEGSFVQIYPTVKTDDYWVTDKVIILTGVKKDEMMAKFGSKYDPRAERLLQYDREEQDR